MTFFLLKHVLRARHFRWFSLAFQFKLFDLKVSNQLEPWLNFLLCYLWLRPPKVRHKSIWLATSARNCWGESLDFTRSSLVKAAVRRRGKRQNNYLIATSRHPVTVVAFLYDRTGCRQGGWITHHFFFGASLFYAHKDLALLSPNVSTPPSYIFHHFFLVSPLLLSPLFTTTTAPCKLYSTIAPLRTVGINRDQGKRQAICSISKRLVHHLFSFSSDDAESTW